MNSYSFPYVAASNKSTLEITYKEQVASDPVCDAIAAREQTFENIVFHINIQSVKLEINLHT